MTPYIALICLNERVSSKRCQVEIALTAINAAHFGSNPPPYQTHTIIPVMKVQTFELVILFMLVGHCQTLA